MNKLKRILILGLIAILCFSVIPTTVAYADSQPFSITGSDGNTYTPVKTDIAAEQEGEIHPTVYCLWVPEDVANLTIRAADTYTTIECSCSKGTLTSEKGENILSLPTSGHDSFCLQMWLSFGNYPGYEKYIDGSCENLIQVKVAAINGGVVTEINYILIQVGGSVPTEDTTPPELSLVADGVQRTGETTATVKFTSSEAGTVYYSLVSANAVDTSTAGTAMVSGENTLNITGITADATTVYIKAKDGSGNVSESTLEAAVPAYETTYEIYLGLWSHAQYYDLGYRVASVTADGKPLSMSGISEVECSGVKAGQTVKVTLFIPEAGKELASVSLITNDGNKTPINVTVDGTENSFTFTMPAANVRTAIGERFTLKDSSIVRYSLKSGVSLLYSNVEAIESNRQGTVTFTDADGVTLMQARPGQQVTVTAQPVPYKAGNLFHREFVRWKNIGGIEVRAEDQLKPSFTFEMPANDVYLFAEIKNVGTEITWKTEPSDVTDIKLEDLGSNYSPFTFADGATLHAFPIVEEGWWYRYEFTGWTVERDGTTLPDSEVSTSLVNSSRPKGSFGYATKVEFKASGEKMIVTANFRERAFASVTAAADAAMGSATVTVGGSTPAETQSVVYEGQTVTLTATPGDRYTLTGWKVKDADGTEIKVTKDAEDANKATFIMPNTDKAITATANFAVDPDKASTDCVLEDVDLAITGATVSREGSKITITLPAGTDTSKLADAMLKFTVSKYADIIRAGDDAAWPAAGKACGMELDKAVTFTVRSEKNLIGKDETAKADYKVTITVAKSSAKEITAVKLLDADKSLIAEGKLSGTTWTITLPSDTDKALINKIGSATDIYMQVLHTGVSVRQEDGWNDADGTPYWNSGDVMCGISVNTSKKFTVTAENGDEQVYTVTIKYTAPNAPTLSNGSATRSSKTAATVKFTTNEAGTYYYKVVTHGAAAPTVDTGKNGTAAVQGENTITLSNLGDGARDIYIVVVNASRGESAALKVEIPAYGSGSETPDTGKFTISAMPPKGGTITTNRTKADKGDEIIVTVTPDSGYQMVEGSLTYTLAVDGGQTVKITGSKFTMPASNVTITCKWETATTTAKGITSFSINGVSGAVNNSTNTITITMPRGTDVTKLTPVIATNGVKSLTPGNGETVDFTNAVTYTAAMEDGSSKTYTVTVYVDKGTLADQFWDKLTDFATQVPWWQYAEKQQSTSKYPKYW